MILVFADGPQHMECEHLAVWSKLLMQWITIVGDPDFKIPRGIHVQSGVFCIWKTK